MVIYTNSPKVRMNRRKTVELILSQHDCRCATCVKSGNCTLQKIANDLNILEVPFQQELEQTPWNKDFPLIRDSSKCIKCMRCIQVCDKIQSLNIWDVESTGSRTTVHVSKNRKIEDADCSLCGQCITHCPVGALRERDDTEKVWSALADKKKVTVVQIAPAVRAAWGGEALGMKREEATVGKIVDALRKIGFDYVFDTDSLLDYVHGRGADFRIGSRTANSKTARCSLPAAQDGFVSLNPSIRTLCRSYQAQNLAADVRCGHENILCEINWCRSGKYLYDIDHALSCKERRTQYGTLL